MLSLLNAESICVKIGFGDLKLSENYLFKVTHVVVFVLCCILLNFVQKWVF